MSKSIDYKAKYQQLFARFTEAVQTSFEKGYEKGYNEGGQDAQAQQMEAMAQQGGVDENGNPLPPGEGEDQGGDPMQAADDAGLQQGSSEVDQHLNELEGLVKKEKSIKAADLSKILSSLNNSFKKIKDAQTSTQLRKSLHPSKRMKHLNKVAKKKSQSFNDNVQEGGKRALSMQEAIVDNIMKSWDKQEQEALKDIQGVLGKEGHTK